MLYIGYGIFRRTSNEQQKMSDMETVRETERVNSHMVPEDGTLTCDKTGICKYRLNIVVPFNNRELKL